MHTEYVFFWVYRVSRGREAYRVCNRYSIYRVSKHEKCLPSLVFPCGYRVSTTFELIEYVIFSVLSSISRCMHTEYGHLVCVIEYLSKRMSSISAFWDYRVSNFLICIPSIYTTCLSSMEFFLRLPSLYSKQNCRVSVHPIYRVSYTTICLPSLCFKYDLPSMYHILGLPSLEIIEAVEFGLPSI